MTTHSLPHCRTLVLAALTLVCALVPPPARSQVRPAPGGDIFFNPDPLTRPWNEPFPVRSPFLLRRTDVHTKVTGPVAHVVVTQTWENPNLVPVDGLYIFPLPENAAVTDLQLTIGDRRIRSEMRRREEARAIYERARQEGRVAGLLDQERPNIFAQRVANLMPGMRVEVVLEFDQEVRCESGDCEYVFPTVVGPRFVPCSESDPGLINPPVVEPGRSTGQRLGIAVDIETGLSLHDLRSPSHRVSVDGRGAGKAAVTLAADEPSALDHDFRLTWSVGGGSPEFGLIPWRDSSGNGGPGAFTLILQPPDDDAAWLRSGEVAGRELFFVLDCSGSMRGVPIEAAKNVVRRALRALRPQDTFQIVRFSDRASGLGPEPIAPTDGNLRRALAYLDTLQGEGGTMMIEGIRAALGQRADPERIRIVAFLTDGYIGNETEILAEVQRSIGGARLFAFGIGSAVNRHLLEGLAEEGRGEAAFLGPRESPDAMVDRFVARIATPVLTDVRITWEDLEVEDLEPAAIPDLFAGQPILVHGRYRKPGTGVVLVEGRRGNLPVTLRRVVTLPDRAADQEAIGRLWARARIHRLTREMYGSQREDLKEAITLLGLRHRLMTAWTSLVAVDSVVSNSGGPAVPVDVPVELPQDVSYEGIFGARGELKMYAAAPPAPAARPAPSIREHRAQGSPANGTESERGVAGGVTGGLRRPDAPDPAGQSGRFVRLTLVELDGSRLVIEEDGEVWVVEGRTRRLARVLTAAQMEELRRAVAATRPDSWSGSASGAWISVETAGTTRVASLRSAGDAIARLADRCRALK